MSIRILFCLLCFQTYIFGQNSYVFNRFSTADGLATNKVKCVWQDPKGFLWIGTEVGIQRFDGRKFLSYVGPENYQLPPSIGVDQILDAGNGDLWLLQGGQIGKFNTVDFHYTSVPIRSFGSIPPRSEFTLYVDSKNQVFLCASKYGLLWYDDNSKSFVESNLPIKIPRGWGVGSLFEDKETGEYWICSEQGLAVYRSTSGEVFYRHNNPEGIPLLNDKAITNSGDFIKDKNGTWWVTYWDYSPHREHPVLLHFDPNTNKILPDTLGSKWPTKKYTVLRQILETSSGQIWIGGENSLLSYDNDLQGFYQHLKSNPLEFDIKCNQTRHIFEDREGNIWLSTENGLYVMNPNQKDVYSLVVIDGLGLDSPVNAILETQDKENWIGTWGKGILFYNDKFIKLDANPYVGLGTESIAKYSSIWDLQQHSESGYVWSGCQGGGLAVFDPQKKKGLHWLHPPVFSNSTIRQLKEDRNGNLWFGTQSGRLVKWNKTDPIADENFEEVHHFNTIIYRLYVDDQGRLWVGTHKQGVYVIDVNTNEILFHFNKEFSDSYGIVDNTIFDIQQYNDSIFLLGTEALNILNINTSKVRKITSYEGLFGSKVLQLMMDREGIAWMITSNGLSSYNYDKNIISSYNNLHGVIYAEKTNSAKWMMQNGEIWFGGEDVVFGFSPEKLNFKQKPPKVSITDFKLFNTYLSVDSIMTQKEIIFNHYQNSFTFYFSALSFSQQKKIQYFYRIPGINKDWVKAEKDLAATYTTMPSGKYTFQVKCMNLQGLEPDEITNIDFRILPPFYRTWWFISLILLTVLGITYFIYRLKVNRILAVENLRNKVARDLHDDMGSTLSTINILSSMAKSKMNNDTVTSSNYLSKITDNSQRMMEAMDDIVWSIKPDNDNMHRVIARMREYATGILEARNIEFNFEVDDKINDLKLDMEARRDLFLTFKEAINNIAKYSQAKRAKVLFTYKDRWLKLQIMDNGIGFEVEKVDSGNGLDNMVKRASNLKGKLKIDSKTDLGTEICLGIPVR
ncbi:hypothetical protein H4O18_07355 [Arenibacter sp. BSSL-BM3]|uniref:Histidine kinase domain-containing protein n=1 Tax=Arenibacter arenosicollis TaxID=2762274 RepID=A0ABR7QKT5_9FLAO|nr:sensor histidine kinase [Arenibacter arenosicollis]MBC8767802.1 hypothetical protein [Arenibacter arenosicollis]